MVEPNLYPVPLDYSPPVLPKFKLSSQKLGDEVLSILHPMYHYLIDEHNVDIEDHAWIQTVWHTVNEVHSKGHTNGTCTIILVTEDI